MDARVCLTLALAPSEDPDQRKCWALCKRGMKGPPRSSPVSARLTLMMAPPHSSPLLKQLTFILKLSVVLYILISFSFPDAMIWWMTWRRMEGGAALSLAILAMKMGPLTSTETPAFSKAWTSFERTLDWLFKVLHCTEGEYNLIPVQLF